MKTDENIPLTSRSDVKTARCRKHEPEWRSDNIIDQLAGRVRCKSCGMEGCYSNGQRRFGRPRRVIWFRRRIFQ